MPKPKKQTLELWSLSFRLWNVQLIESRDTLHTCEAGILCAKKTQEGKFKGGSVSDRKQNKQTNPNKNPPNQATKKDFPDLAGEKFGACNQ